MLPRGDGDGVVHVQNEAQWGVVDNYEFVEISSQQPQILHEAVLVRSAVLAVEAVGEDALVWVQHVDDGFRIRLHTPLRQVSAGSGGKRLGLSTGLVTIISSMRRDQGRGQEQESEHVELRNQKRPAVQVCQ